MLSPGTASNQIEMKNGSLRTIPFSIRCDGTGEETYADGTPKRWWSKLAVVDGGREMSRKEIVVNDPLVYQGVRFYQASYGRTGQARSTYSECDSGNWRDPHAAGNFARDEPDRRTRCRHQRATGGVHS